VHPASSWRPRAILFDFDGTLADSYPAITASVNHVRQLHQLPPLEVDEVKRHVGRGPEHLVRHTIPGAEVAHVVALYREHHPSVMLAGTELLPGALDALATLHQAGIRLGVCSNKPVGFTRVLLEHLGLTLYLSVVVGPEDVPRPKPAPDMLLLALQRLEVQAADALFIGDMTVDIATARAAGVRVWIVPTGSDAVDDLRAAAPDRLLNGLADLATAY
jgi:phosphoglycolate phosphatase